MTYINGKPLREYTKTELNGLLKKLFFVADDEIIRDILDAIKLREEFERKLF